MGGVIVTQATAEPSYVSFVQVQLSTAARLKSSNRRLKTPHDASLTTGKEVSPHWAGIEGITTETITNENEYK